MEFLPELATCQTACGDQMDGRSTACVSCAVFTGVPKACSRAATSPSSAIGQPCWLHSSCMIARTLLTVFFRWNLGVIHCRRRNGVDVALDQLAARFAPPDHELRQVKSPRRGGRRLAKWTWKPHPVHR